VFQVTPGSVLEFLRGRGSLFGASGLRRIVETHLPFTPLEDAVLPVSAAATDLVLIRGRITEGSGSGQVRVALGVVVRL
jgi:hypothetical protein